MRLHAALTKEDYHARKEEYLRAVAPIQKAMTDVVSRTAQFSAITAGDTYRIRHQQNVEDFLNNCQTLIEGYYRAIFYRPPTTQEEA